jgi:hypothetical protein
MEGGFGPSVIDSIATFDLAHLLKGDRLKSRECAKRRPMRSSRPIPGAMAAFSILTSVAIILVAIVIGGLWLLTFAVQRLLIGPV